MASRANRRWLCLFIALLFAISGVARVCAATTAMMQMPASAIEGSMPTHDDDCDGKDRAAHIACLAMCATAMAILTDPAVIVVATKIQDRRSASEDAPVSHHLSPDPPPPKK